MEDAGGDSNEDVTWLGGNFDFLVDHDAEKTCQYVILKTVGT
jgi:hypothetical protein